MKIKFLFSLAAIFLLIITSLTPTPVHSQKAEKAETKQNQQVQKKQIANADAPRFALMVGINKYKFGTEIKPKPNEKAPNPLNGPENDVDAMVRLLISDFGFTKENIRILKSKDAFVEEVFKYAVNNVPDLAKGNGLIQQPRVFTPEQSQDFFIGRFTQEEQKLFTLAKIKPVILSPTFLNQTLLRDNLNLNALLKLAFQNASSTTTRGGRDEVKIVFVEADEMYDAIRPSGVYEINGNTIRLKIVLSKNNNSIGEQITVTGNINDKDALVKNIVETITQAARKIERGE